MSHTVGTVPQLTPALEVGPDTGEPATGGTTWAKAMPYVPAPSGTKFVILHFINVDLPPGNRLEVDLGYDTDVFTNADGGQFWTRPVNVATIGGGTAVPIRYVAAGTTSGIAHVDRYARGENLQSYESGHDSLTNCDPFLPGPWVEPVFPFGPGETDPKYDPFWICNKTASPRWQNVQCEPPADLRRTIARSVGMILTIHAPTSAHPFESVGTCSVTLIDSDLVVLAGHCIADYRFEVPTSSVTFDYEVDCAGNVAPTYDATFYKVMKLVKYRNADERDYAILQLRGAPALPPIPVATELPSEDDLVFGVHHPNGAVKKISPAATSATPVTSIENGRMIHVNLDVAGGSSGSGLFDTMGQIVGVLAHGWSCDLHYSATAVMLDDPVLIPDPPTERRVMVVLDRSGSMSESAGDGKVKIDEARKAAELFTRLLREAVGNHAGLVSFATTAGPAADSALGPVDAAKKQQLLNLLPGLTPGGRTSIGGGLQVARNELPMPGAPPRAILLLTDGMENEPPMISEVAGLDQIDITAIGFGTESNLDGPRLTNLAQTHNGFYKRAGTGLELKKFFALAFGDIFEAGALADPEDVLPADVSEGRWMPFNVCQEETITVVLGWDTDDARLRLEVRTPSGQVVDLTDAALELESGGTWQFVRIPLPYEGEREGVWHAMARRAGHGGDEFPPPDVDVRYFLNVIARGGPSLRPIRPRRRLYTGDTLNPLVMLQYPDESVPRGGEVILTLRRPEASVGTALAQAGLGTPRVVGGDTIPARLATLSAIEAVTGHAVTDYIEETLELSSDSESTGSFMPSGLFGRNLDDVLVVEGNYTFHARARFGLDCETTRETQWSHHVSVGIDPDHTIVVATPGGSGSSGDRTVVTITPMDRYGNYLGPGAGDGLDVSALPGCTLVGPLADLGDGRYTQEVECDEADQPGISVGQPDRPPVDLIPPVLVSTRYVYTAEVLCGTQDEHRCDCHSIGPGRYTTAITVVNTSDRAVRVTQHVTPTELSGAVTGRWPESAGRRASDRLVLEPGAATTIDCCSIGALLLGATPSDPHPITLGAVVLETPVEVAVIATYTIAKRKGQATSVDIEPISPVIRSAVRKSGTRVNQ